MNDDRTRLRPKIVSINISQGGIPKYPQERIRITETGLEGDGHNHEKHYRRIQAVCLQDLEKLEDLRSEGYPLFAGTTGENLTLQNMNVNSLPPGTVLSFSGGVVLEITKVRKPCYVLDRIHPRLKEDIFGRCGMYAKVLQEGVLSLNDVIEIHIPSLQSS